MKTLRKREGSPFLSLHQHFGRVTESKCFSINTLSLVGLGLVGLVVDEVKGGWVIFKIEDMVWGEERMAALNSINISKRKGGGRNCLA